MGVSDIPPNSSANEYLSIKEWLAAISAKLDRMENMLTLKADVNVVQAIEIRVGTMEKTLVENTVRGELLLPLFEETRADVGRLKESMSRVGAVESYRRWLFGSVGFGVVSSGIAIASLVVK